MRIIGNGSQYDQLQVNGNVTLGSGSLTSSGLYVSFDPSQLQANTFPNFIAYLSITGTFNISTLAGYFFYASYGSTSITLTTFPPGPYPTPRRTYLATSWASAAAATSVADAQRANYANALELNVPLAQPYPFGLSDESLHNWMRLENTSALDNVFDTDAPTWMGSLAGV